MIALELLHGRVDPEEHLSSWGSDGPIFLVRWIHVTYLLDVRIGLEDVADEEALTCVDTLIYYDGVYYGDWNVLDADEVLENPDCYRRIVPFDRRNAVRQ